jgi:hypothetical protein
MTTFFASDPTLQTTLEQIIEQLRRSDDLVDLPGICFIRASGSSELGARGVVAVHPHQVVYTQILGVDE